MGDRDVLLIEEYIRENEYKPDLKDSTYFFRIHSYSNFAMNEILRRVIYESSRLPAHITGKESLTLIEIIEDFICEMEHCSSIAKRSQIKEIFDISRDEAKCILLYICLLEEKENINE